MRRYVVSIPSVSSWPEPPASRTSRSAHDLDEAGLDNPVWTALTGPQASLAQARGGAARYPEESGFAGVHDWTSGEDWAGLSELFPRAGR
jgi:hypothetical protein